MLESNGNSVTLSGWTIAQESTVSLVTPQQFLFNNKPLLSNILSVTFWTPYLDRVDYSTSIHHITSNNKGHTVTVMMLEHNDNGISE
jgi:hypothetical protein